MKIEEYRYLIFPLFLILSACKQKEHFEIFTSETFDFLEQEIDYLDQKALVVLDIDDTIFSLDRASLNQPPQFFDSVDQEMSESEKDIIDGLLHQIIPVVIEPRIAGLINRLQQKGIKVIALTAGGHGNSNCINDLMEYRRHLLHAIGIHFERSFPGLYLFPFLNLARRRYIPLFYHGILFSAPSTKGKVLASFLKKMHLKPSLLLYVDDNENNVEEIADTALQLHISGQGVHFTGAQHLPEKVLRLYNQKLDFLFKNGRWLSDDEAKCLLA